MDPLMPKATFLKDYLPPAFLVDTVDLTVTLGEEETLVRARLAIRANPRRGGDRGPLVLDGERLELRTLTLDGRSLSAADYQLTPTSLTLPRVPGVFTLEVVTAIRPQDNLALEGLYKSGAIFCTQCEAEGFRKITYFPDRPDVMARYSTTIEADATRYPVLLSNGNPAAGGSLPGGRHWMRWEDPFPKPCYLFALVAGRLDLVEDSFTTRSGRRVALRLYVEPGNQDKCAHAVRSLKKAMTWDEAVYGLEYDLDIFMIVAVGDFNMGAMENKGLNIFNTKYVLARPETATDADFLAIEAVIAHEYFHNWTGNRVTCRDWFQLSLKEGLTVFRDQHFSSDMNSAAVKRIADVQRLRAGQFAEDAGALAHPVRPDSYIEINNFYTATVYDKGAEVVRMIHTLLGAAAFRKGIDLYFQRHDGEAVTCDDFVAAMEDASAVDLRQYRSWYRQAGTPELEVDGVHDRSRGSYRLTVRQHCPPTPGQPVKLPMHIPLALGLIGPDGRDLPLRLAGEAAPGGTTRVLELRGAEQGFEFLDVAEPPVPSLLRGFSAPVKLRSPHSDADLAFQLAHDSDPFNRWEAGQTLATRLMLGLIGSYRAGRPLGLAQSFIEAFGRLLADAGRDRAFAAKALTLPGEGYLAQQMAVIDVDAIHLVREFVRRRLAESLKEGWLATYHTSLAPQPIFSIDAEAIGRRALKGLALAYLMALESRESYALAAGQYRAAVTMTDSIEALALLATSDAPEREPALEDFYRRWHHDPLVVNKWLSIQAGSSRTDTLARVTALLDHPGFDIRNPNKVYALIGSFGSGNQARFHAADGSGYAFLADQILRLDPMNPQVASRLAGPFARWRRFDAGRQALMRRQLGRLAGSPALSRDVSEIVSKSLNGADSA
ncbi:MAG: aminopeptidase N [Rhodospirillaceae bacterium]